MASSATRHVSGRPHSQYKWELVGAHFRGGKTEDHP